MLSGRISQFARNFITSASRRSEHDHGGIPGKNIPFDISNRYKLTVLFIAFFGSGVGAPFMILRHQLLKK
ncbi:cytochrome c oxidase subunit 7C, mitochondrial-like [Zootermopsis nevadensis]|uniref:Cytochrome c oxidase subunit 7C, mitochondrial n=1 Tax=Zootermopsis nevadensis TaxID=136037 RepID=A0A067RGB5_ZOONE|nr:cytochrome c oxidase subunit 7C, mitochondrial-like [Zootermopsis nevadensis]KDR19224.1 Cytochrome c oxidase subunit 7C, mitochondrial [Zootermopsis nevadensis]